MRWASIDPAKNKSGVALWENTTLMSTVFIRPVGKSGWTAERDGRKNSKAGHKPEHRCWIEVLGDLDVAIAEIGRGKNRSSDQAVAGARHYIRALCDVQSVRFLEVELSTWHRAIADEMRELGEPLTWGVGDDTKAQALTLVTRLYGLSGITSDEADAVLIGRAAMRLRLV